MQNSGSGSGNLYGNGTATTNVNNAITAAGGTALVNNYYYWCASEYDPNYAVHVNFSSSYVSLSYGHKDYTGKYVRAVLAF